MKKLTFREGLSNNYKDLVQKLLLIDPDDRLPLIRVFDHPWVMHFQEKYNIKKMEENMSSEDEQEMKQSFVEEEEIELSFN